jgi:hypothetical protein
MCFAPPLASYRHSGFLLVLEARVHIPGVGGLGASDTGRRSYSRGSAWCGPADAASHSMHRSSTAYRPPEWDGGGVIGDDGDGNGSTRWRSLGRRGDVRVTWTASESLKLSRNSPIQDGKRRHSEVRSRWVQLEGFIVTAWSGCWVLLPLTTTSPMPMFLSHCRVRQAELLQYINPETLEEFLLPRSNS